MSDSIIVRVTLDSYDVVHPSEKQTQVYVQIPGVARASWLLDADFYRVMKGEPWPHVVDSAQEDYVQRGVVSDSDSAAARAAIVKWLADDAHRDAMQVAWFMEEARRHPVSRSLLRDKERLTAELEQRSRDLTDIAAERDRLRIRLDDVHRVPQDNVTSAEVRLGQYATPPRTFASETERALFQIACGLRESLEETRDQRNSARLKVLGLGAHPLAWAEQLDETSLGNFLHTLGMATEVRPIEEALSQVREVIRSFREAVPEADGITRRIAPTQALREDEPAEADRVVAYRAGGSGSLYCRNCCYTHGTFVPLTSDDLPDGGLCDACGRDVLTEPGGDA